MATPWITDAELLALSLAADALADILSTTRDTHRAVASAEVRSVIETRFAPDGWTPDDDVKSAVAAIAAESLLAHRGYNPGGNGVAVAERAKRARAWLVDVRDGKALPLGWEDLTDRRGPLVAGTDASRWASWRTGGL
jgi:hypothetical protein